MPDIKNLLTPKVAIPAFAAVVLLVAATLVAIFYIRNPTVTDNLFNHDEETTPNPEDDHKQKLVAGSGSYQSQTTSPVTTSKILTTLTAVTSAPASTVADVSSTTNTAAQTTPANLDSSAYTVHSLEHTNKRK